MAYRQPVVEVVLHCKGCCGSTNSATVLLCCSSLWCMCMQRSQGKHDQLWWWFDFSMCDDVLTFWLLTFAIARLYLVNQTFSTEHVAAAKLHWLICNAITDDASKLTDVHWWWKWEEVRWSQNGMICWVETWRLAHFMRTSWISALVPRYWVLIPEFGSLPGCLSFLGQPLFALLLCVTSVTVIITVWQPLPCGQCAQVGGAP